MNLADLYHAAMQSGADTFDFSKGLWTVRLWDGMDGCWTDMAEATAVPGEVALRVWSIRTQEGKKKISCKEIDYYRIFPADTRMLWDGFDGREMSR